MDTKPTPMLDYVLGELDKRRGSWKTVAEKAGVPYRTLQKIGQRVILDPGVTSVQSLHDFFRSEERQAEPTT